MTLEEAKKEIDRMTEEKWEAYEKSCCSTTLGEAYGLEEAMSILDQVNGVPVGKADKWTLRTLALELRKIFKFRYLTIDYDYPASLMGMWYEKPEFGFSCWDRSTGYLGDFSTSALNIELNLSEYKDADGNIDYSKCIVEVE